MTDKEHDQIIRIAARMVELAVENGERVSTMDLAAPMAAVHDGECLLRLDDMETALDADGTYDVAHDVFGIARYGRPDGTLTDCFWPRFAAR